MAVGRSDAERLKELVARFPERRVAVLADLVADEFIHGDIAKPADLRAAFSDGIDWVVNFAAETHVDTSIEAPLVFAETNLLGTLRLLMFALAHDVSRFVHISTDEVYGSTEEGYFKETDAHRPSSPYACPPSEARPSHWGRSC